MPNKYRRNPGGHLVIRITRKPSYFSVKVITGPGPRDFTMCEVGISLFHYDCNTMILCID